MPSDALFSPQPVRETLTEKFARFVVAARKAHPRSARLGRFLRPEKRLSAVALDARRADLVALAIDRLGPASMHAAAYGTPCQVIAPDEEIASIFRAALAITGERRCTDRLVRVVVRETR